MDYCRKCKKQTKSNGVPVFEYRKKRWRRISNCRLCGSVKNNVSKSPEDIELNEVFKPCRKNFTTRHVIQKGIDDTWQADLLSFYRPKGNLKDPTYNFRHERQEQTENDYKKMLKANSGYWIILVVIDTFSKFVWLVALKTKSGKEVTEAFAKIIEESGRKPKKLHVDRGKEFYNKDFKRLLDELGIEIYSTQTEKKASIVERVNRTIGDKLKPIIHKHLKWIDALPKIAKDYNNSYHRTIKMKPNQVTKENEGELLSTVYSFEFSKSQPKFEVGDRVRLSAYSQLFRNKLKTNWTKEIFTVDKILRSNVNYYFLVDITSTVYEEELQLTKL